jgi:hypothetical protein
MFLEGNGPKGPLKYHPSEVIRREMRGRSNPEEKDGRRCHFANSGWLSGCWDCLGRKLPRGASKRVDADRPTPPVAAIAVDASALNRTISEKQMTDVVRVTRTRELLGTD